MHLSGVKLNNAAQRGRRWCLSVCQWIQRQENPNFQYHLVLKNANGRFAQKENKSQFNSVCVEEPAWTWEHKAHQINPWDQQKFHFSSRLTSPTVSTSTDADWKEVMPFSECSAVPGGWPKPCLPTAACFFCTVQHFHVVTAQQTRKSRAPPAQPQPWQEGNNTAHDLLCLELIGLCRRTLTAQAWSWEIG